MGLFSRVRDAVNAAEDAHTRSEVWKDTKVHAYNAVTIATISAISLTIFSGLTGGSGYALYLTIGILSLATREIIRRSIESERSLAAVKGALTESMARHDEETRLLSYIFKFPTMTPSDYVNNFHLLFS